MSPSKPSATQPSKNGACMQVQYGQINGKFNIANEFEINHFDKAGVPMCIDYVIAKSLPPFTSSLCV